ncbi:MAG: FtsH protease activity modulator HflK [Clostridiales bacterium]|nr:FtsH protease activity modulator HflK [Clostridiales bacterium]
MKKSKLTLIVLLAAVLVIGLVAMTGFYRVGQGEEALELTFGEVTGKHGPGLYWHMPGIQSVISESVTTIHTMEYGFRTTRQGSAGRAAVYVDEEDEGVMITSDNSIVSLEAIYQYTIRDVEKYTFDVDQPEETLQLAFEAVIRRNIQSRTLDDALLNKEQIETEVLPDFQALIDSYDMGVKINNVRIQNITVPQAVASAYEDVNNAMNEKTKRLDEAERYKNSILPTARSNAHKVTADAEAYKAETIAAAQADVAVFTAILEEYKAAPEIMRTRLLIETLEEVLASSGKLYIVDGSTTRLLTLNGAGAEEAAAVTGGDR